MEDFYKVGEKWLKTAASTTSNIASTTSSIVATSGAKALEYIGSSSGRPEVPARAAIAAAVARQIAALPPHERHSRSSSVSGTPSLYAARPAGKAEELEEKYYEEGFDPIRYMLEHLPEDSNEMTQEYFDMKGGSRLLQLDMITERLSRQVMENHEAMVRGMQLVTELDRDLQLTNIICKNGRRFLSMAAQEVTHDLLVASNVRKKQVLLDLLPVLERIQMAMETKARLDSTVEDKDYGLALQLCQECVLLLEEYSALKAVSDVNQSLEEWLQRTMDDVDRMLLEVCLRFDSSKFSSALFAYLILGDISGLSEKVQTLFAQAVVSETHAVIRNFLFEAQDPQIQLQKSRVPYNDLCSLLTEANFKDCLHKTLEILFNLLSSYYQMMTWKPPSKLVSASNQTLHLITSPRWRVGRYDEVTSNGDSPKHDESNTGEDDPDGTAGRVRDAMLSVARALERGRKTVWELSARRVAVLLSCDALCTSSPHQFLQSLDRVNKFILAGEAFCGVGAMSLRAKLVKQSEKYYWTFHRQNLEVLRVILGKELWQEIPSPALKNLSFSGLTNGTAIKISHDPHSHVGTLKLEYADNFLLQRDKSSPRGNFEDWLGRGNPFSNRKLHKISKAGENGMLNSEDHQQVAHEQGILDEDEEDEDLLADFIDEDSQRPGRSFPEYRRSPSKSTQVLIDDDSLVFTSSAVTLLRYMDKYVRLMQILQPIVSEVFRGMCQLFELYIFTIFKVFGNRDFLSTPLRATLLRISQGLEEQRVQLPAPMLPVSPSRTASAGSSISATNSNLSLELSPTSGTTTALSMLPNNLYALKERAVAVESLLCLSQILQRSHSNFKNNLPKDTIDYMEQFFVETVEIVPALRIHIFKVPARQMLNISGYADRIANLRWELKDLGMEHNGYVDLLLGEFKQYTNKLSQGNLSNELRGSMLEAGVDVLAETILEGISRVKKCNNEGRALMSLDLQVLINGLQHLAGTRFKGNLLIVETYVKAFYLPETEYFHWTRAHPEYTKAQVVGLINLVASTYGWKRKARIDLLERIENSES